MADCAARTQCVRLFKSSVNSNTAAIKSAETRAGRRADMSPLARKATTNSLTRFRTRYTVATGSKPCARSSDAQATDQPGAAAQINFNARGRFANRAAAFWSFALRICFCSDKLLHFTRAAEY